MTVVYEDNHLIIVNKSSSEIVQGDKTGDTPLVDMVKEYIKQKYQKPGNVFLGVVHRLDRPVSGLVVFARTSKALARLNEMFRTKEVHKTYWALVANCPPRRKAGWKTGWCAMRGKISRMLMAKRCPSPRKRYWNIGCSTAPTAIICLK